MVENRFKVGDWVIAGTSNSGMIGMIDEINDSEIWIEWKYETNDDGIFKEWNGYRTIYDYDRNVYDYLKILSEDEVMVYLI